VLAVEHYPTRFGEIDENKFQCAEYLNTEEKRHLPKVIYRVGLCHQKIERQTLGRNRLHANVMLAFELEVHGKA
jgi:hypothetical protein